MTFAGYSWQAARPPKGWTKRIRSALIHAVSLAGQALLIARGQAAASRSLRRRFQAELDKANTEITLLMEELHIKDARWSRLSSRKRPHYTPIERMRILQLKAARGWSREQAAGVFLIDEQTLRSWSRRVGEEGERVLVQIQEPVNKFPGFVRWHVDLTTVPTAAGFWIPWLPFALPQQWPFCSWIAVVVDHFSRAVVGFAVFFGRPTSAQVQRSLGRAIRQAGHPSHIIRDPRSM